MADYTGIPAKLADMVSMLSGMDRAERIQVLIDLGDKFKPVPAEVATQPYPDSAKAPHCESEAFVFPKVQDDGTLMS
jgi:sulfur transfer protein SufE